MSRRQRIRPGGAVDDEGERWEVSIGDGGGGGINHPPFSCSAADDDGKYAQPLRTPRSPPIM